MDIIKVVTLALYLPMALVFVLCSIFFLKSGYKKGFWRSLISLGATVVAVILSLLLGKLFGQLLAAPIAANLTAMIPSSDGIPLQMLASIIQSVIQAVLTFVLFGIFMVVTLILCKIFSKKIHFAQMDKEPTDKKGVRFAGMGLRWLDAVIVTLVVLIPLYGPLSVTMPVVSGVAGVVSDESSTAVQLVKALDAHPVMAVYKSGPVSVVSKSLSDVSLGGETIDTAKIMSVIEGTINRVMVYSEADEQAKVDALAELVGYVRENVIEEGWSYDLVQALLKEANDPKYTQEADVKEGMQIVNTLLDTDRETFKSNGVAVLEFIEYALQNDFMVFYKTSNYEALSPEFYEKLGTLINHSEQAVYLKKLLFADSLNEIFKTREEAMSFIEQRISGEPLPKEQQKQEGESFMRIFFERENVDKLEALARHPEISAEDVKPLMTEQVLGEVVRYMFLEEEASLSPEFLRAAQAQFAGYDTAPLRNYTFSDYLYAVCIFEQMLTAKDTYFRGFDASDALLQDIVNTVDDGFYRNSTMDAKKVKKILNQALEEAKEQPGVWGYVDIVGVYKGESEQAFAPRQDISIEDFLQGGSGIVVMPPNGNGDDYQFVIGENGEVIVQPSTGADEEYSYIVSPDGGITFIPGN